MTELKCQIAKRGGICPVCGLRFKAGERVARVNGLLIHVECAAKRETTNPAERVEPTARSEHFKRGQISALTAKFSQPDNKLKEAMEFTAGYLSGLRKLLLAEQMLGSPEPNDAANDAALRGTF